MCYSLPFYCSKYEPIIWSSSNAFLYLRLRGSSPCYLSDLFNASENNTSTNLLSQALFCIFEIFILWHKINCKRLKFKKTSTCSYFQQKNTGSGTNELGIIIGLSVAVFAVMLFVVAFFISKSNGFRRGHLRFLRRGERKSAGRLQFRPETRLHVIENPIEKLEVRNLASSYHPHFFQTVSASLLSKYLED